jgi:hypothetical protein
MCSRHNTQLTRDGDIMIVKPHITGMDSRPVPTDEPHANDIQRKKLKTHDTVSVGPVASPTWDIVGLAENTGTAAGLSMADNPDEGVHHIGSMSSKTLPPESVSSAHLHEGCAQSSSTDPEPHQEDDSSEATYDNTSLDMENHCTIPVGPTSSLHTGKAGLAGLLDTMRMSVSQSETTATSLVENNYSRMFNQNQDMSMKDDITHTDMVHILHDQTPDQVPTADTGCEIEFANTTSSLRDQTFNSSQHTGTENAVVKGTTDGNLQPEHQVASHQRFWCCRTCALNLDDDKGFFINSPSNEVCRRCFTLRYDTHPDYINSLEYLICRWRGCLQVNTVDAEVCANLDCLWPLPHHISYRTLMRSRPVQGHALLLSTRFEDSWLCKKCNVVNERRIMRCRGNQQTRNEQCSGRKTQDAIWIINRTQWK